MRLTPRASTGRADRPDTSIRTAPKVGSRRLEEDPPAAVYWDEASTWLDRSGGGEVAGWRRSWGQSAGAWDGSTVVSGRHADLPPDRERAQRRRRRRRLRLGGRGRRAQAGGQRCCPRPPARGGRARRESRDPRSRPGPRALALRGRLGVRDGAAGACGGPPARLAARQGPRRLELSERDDLGARRARGLRHLGVPRRGRLVVGGRAAGLRAHRAARARRAGHGEPAHVVRAGRDPRVDRRGGARSAGSR